MSISRVSRDLLSARFLAHKLQQMNGRNISIKGISKDPQIAELLIFALEELLQHVWQGLPVRFALAGRDDEMKIAVEKAALGRLEASEACF